MTNADLTVSHDDLPLVVCDNWTADQPEVR